jgi:hypothetical protein
MRIISATVGPLAAASVNAIVTSASGTAGTALTLTTSPYVLDTPRRIIITSAGNDSAHTFTIVGTDWNSTPVTETLTGATATNAAQSAYDYATIVSITPVQNTTSTVQVGTNGVASTRPIHLDQYAFPQVTVQVNVTGTVNATVQQTLDGPGDYTTGYPGLVWINSADTNAVTLTSNVMSWFVYTPRYVRLLLNSGSGSATIRISQPASVPL